MTLTKRIPRYTSYPIYPKWNNVLNNEDLIDQIKNAKDTDLYIHVPFCVKPCFYCGCNRIIAKQGTKELDYVETLKNEWDLYSSLNSNIDIKSLHFGGGTPTFLSSDLLDDLLKHILKKQNIPKFSVEIDPRITTSDQVEVLVKHGLSRISMGIQDFTPEVQKIINRIQPVHMVDNLVLQLRSLGVSDINFDLIYGLPKQNLESIKFTIDQVANMMPSTISLFAYAHVPSMFKLQNRLSEFLPKNKDELYVFYKEQLIELGYKQIGLDHFALESSLLWKDYIKNKIGRNFMGYTSEKATSSIGLGVSAISEFQGCFYQNEKNIETYHNRVQLNELPYFYSHCKEHYERYVADVIEKLMCYKKASIKSLLSIMEPSRAQKLLTTFNKKFKENDMVKIYNGVIEVSSNRELDLRAICYELDQLTSDEASEVLE